MQETCGLIQEPDESSSFRENRIGSKNKRT